MSITIEELQNEYNGLLQRARPIPHVYRFLTERSDDGTPHVEIIGDEYHFVSTERGLDLFRKSFGSKDEILYEMIALDTFWMGVDFEFKNRIESLDCRRMIFAKQLELLNLIDPEWGTTPRCGDREDAGRKSVFG
ncbi:MAG: hypothetical protein IPK58_05505 [Acidobacteria bacterium]|nr:hypothetical protein [Acidobacteriota bacterium]